MEGGVIQLKSAFPEAEIFQDVCEMFAEDWHLLPPGWLKVGPADRSWCSGKGLGEKQRRIVNGRGARIRALAFHGIKSRVAGILRSSIHVDQSQKGIQGPTGHSVGFPIEGPNTWEEGYKVRDRGWH